MLGLPSRKGVTTLAMSDQSQALKKGDNYTHHHIRYRHFFHRKQLQNPLIYFYRIVENITNKIKKLDWQLPNQSTQDNFAGIRLLTIWRFYLEDSNARVLIVTAKNKLVLWRTTNFVNI